MSNKDTQPGTAQGPKRINGKAGWGTAFVGIPVAVLLTWAWVGGGLARQVEANTGTCERAAEEFRKMDNRVTRLETIYERTAQDISEMKGMLREKRQEIRVP